MSSGLRCPECDSRYSESMFSYGEECGNQATTGPHPELCSPKHPCKGRLVFAKTPGIDVLNDKEAIRAAFEADD